MKKIYTLFSLCFILCFTANAQQLNQFDQFTKNNFVYNPASTGMEHYTDISANYRRQWAGFQNAPKSFLLSVSSRMLDRTVSKADAPPSIFISDNSLYGKLGMTEEKVNPTPHAFGGYILTDRNGPFERFSAFLNYAYHLQVSQKSTLAFGIGAGYSRQQINVNSLETVDVNDQVITNYQSNDNAVSYADIKAGLTYYGEHYFVGYSANQLNRQEIYEGTNGSDARLEIHHTFSGGYVFDLSENLELYPTVLVRAVDGAPAAYDGAMRLRFDQKVWIGGGYRYKDAASAQFGLTLENAINLGYSYAFSTSEIKNVNDGSHEISLGVMLFNGVPAPTKMW